MSRKKPYRGIPRIVQRWKCIKKGKKKVDVQRWYIEGVYGFECRHGFKTLDSLWRGWNWWHDNVQLCARRLPMSLMLMNDPKPPGDSAKKVEAIKDKFFSSQVK